jgi:3-oxoadipate enol-lactonase
MPTTNNGIYYEQRGDGPDTMIMLPGLGCSIQCWSDVAPLLGGYRLILIDLPGQGGSVGARADGTSIATLSQPVIEACDELGLDKFGVVGLSLGATVGVRLALDRPSQVVAAMAFMPWPASGTEADDPFLKVLYGHLENRDADAIAEGTKFISLDPSRTTDAARTMMTVTEQFWQSWLTGGIYTSMSEELPRLIVPTCYIVGGKDVIAPRDKLISDVRAMPGGRLILLSDAGHLAPYEAPELVAREIREFMGRYTKVSAETA